MRFKLVKVLLTVLLVLGLSLPGCAAFSMFPLFPQDSANRAQILANDIQLLKQNAGEDGKVAVLIKLHGAPLGGVEEDDVVEELSNHAVQSQKEVLELLYTKGATVLNTFWLTNAILAEVQVGLLDELSSIAEIERFFENFTITIPEPQEDGDLPQVLSIDYTWGLDKLRVPDVWDMGITGSGVRVAVLDTGVDITHPDLAGKMWTDDPEDPTYPGGWIEFSGNGSIVVGSTPHDTYGHGTHCSGTVLGGDASGIAIGVAPDAILMHGIVAPEGYTTVAQIIAGMEWCIDPFDQYGTSAGEPADVVTMSLGYYGYNDPFIEPVQNMKAAGIVLSASIGNDGEGNSGSPGNVYETFGIGATYYEDLVAEFSGGEVIDWPASNPESYIKPDFSAPGVLVYSSVPGGYEYSSGTSMASPHVAGTVALMLEGNPALTVEDVYTLLRDSAVDLGDEGQDTRYGWGRIDAFNSVSFAASNSGIEGTITDVETEQPLEDARIFVSETGQIRYSDASGYYRAFLPPGTYNVTVSAFGYYQGNNATVEVVEDTFTSQDFALELMPTGFIAGNVTDLETGYPIENSVVTVLDTPLSTNTSGTGEYFIEVPVGTYNLTAWALGYLESIASNITVAEDETITVDFTLESAPVVAVLGDYESQLTDLLLANDIWAEERGWDIIDDIGYYDVVVVNCPSDPGEITFLEFLESASNTQTRVVFTSSWGGAPYGISLLRWYLGDPADSGYAYGYGNVYYQVTQDHPLFDGWGLGESITIITGGDYDLAWFSDYSGCTIADIGSEYYGIWGAAIAVSEYGESLHVLLAGLAPQSYTNIPDWTEDAKTIFVRAVVTDIELDLAVKDIELPPGEVGEEYRATLDAMGGTKPYTWAIIDGALPDGLVLDNETGIISGIPTESGIFDFTVEVTDAAEATATGELSINIMAWTEFITDPVSDQFDGSGPDIVGVDFCLDEATVYLRVRTAQPIDSSIINDMFFDLDMDASTGFVSDDPDWPTNDIGVDAGAEFLPLFYGTTGDLYLWDSYYEYFYYAGSFPVFTDTDYFWFGISLDMLNNPGTMHVVDVIGDILGEGFTDFAPNTGHGIITTDALGILTTRLRYAFIQSFYEVTLRAYGGTEPYTWNIVDGALPNGLDLNSATGVISGTPTTADTFSFVVEVCDAGNNTATASLLLNVFEGCFIATAAYGTDTAEGLDILREFRDTVLMPDDLGARLVSLYYENSPPIANFISQHEVLRTAVRVFFIDPLVRMLSWTHDSWLP